MPNLEIVFDAKAQTQFSELDTDTQAQLMRDLAAYIEDVLKYKGKWLESWAVQSEPYRILIRAQHDKQRVVIMDISRKRFASQ